MSDSLPLSKSRDLLNCLRAFAPLRKIYLFGTLTVCLILLTGCIGYQVGAGSLYAPDIATVYVPMIESDSYRRDLGERLTEAVVKEIELKTPYKVVNSPDADSILTARLVSDSRNRLIQNGFSDPRVSLTDLR